MIESENENAPGVTADVLGRLAYDAHAGTSFSPGERAKSERIEFTATLNGDYAAFSRAADTPDKQAILAEEWPRYRDGYTAKYKAWLVARSRIMSTMIAGPSNFPVARMEKRNQTERNRLNDLIEGRKRAFAAVMRKIAPEDTGVKLGDANAVESLQAKIDERTATQERMKAVNALLRKMGVKAVRKSEGWGYEASFTKATREEVFAALVAMGLPEKGLGNVVFPDDLGRIGFPDYALKNNNAEIRRLTARLAEVSKVKALPETEKTYGDVKVVENPDLGRIQLIFPGKPDEATRTQLKSLGFRWAPSEGAWQRHLNGNGQYAVRQFLLSKGLLQQA